MIPLVNLYPATVVVGKNISPTAHDVGRFFAWRDTDDGPIRVRLYRVGATGIEVGHEGVAVEGADLVSKQTTTLVTLESGEVWTVSPGGGCGCGSPLKAFNPALHEIPA